MWATKEAVRVPSGKAQRVISKSMTGKTAAAFSGHSANFSPGLAKISLKPASSHSRASSKRKKSKCQILSLGSS